MRRIKWLAVLGLPLALTGCVILFVYILSPLEYSQFVVGQPITFSAIARDAMLGDVRDNHMVWTSSISGVIGTGDTFAVSSLPVGDHTITLRVDSPFPFSHPREAAVHIRIVRGAF